MVTVHDIRQVVHGLGLAGKPLCVHSSLRSFGLVDGGATTVVAGLLDVGCTVVMPSFCNHFTIAPPEDMRPARNGWDYACDRNWPGSGRPPYTTGTNLIDRDMGAIPSTILAHPQRVRGNHPIDSFAALGPMAHDLIDQQTPVDVYAPLRALAERGGYVVLMGVGLDRMTALHLAEQMAGRKLLRRWALGPDGNPLMVATGSCSNGFPRLDDTLSPVDTCVNVGSSSWRIFPLREALDLAAGAIRANPEITRCADPSCIRCEDSIAGGPIL
jgi:aminoglycoside N3'-acetyltransferase